MQAARFIVIITVVSVLLSCASAPEAPVVSSLTKSVPPPARGDIVQTEGEGPSLVSYPVFAAAREPGPVVPGLYQSAVPQGLAYDPDRRLMLISNYMDDGRPSVVTAVSMPGGELQSVLWIHEPDGSPHAGHVGGLAVSDRNLWIASGSGVYSERLRVLDGSGPLQMSSYTKTAVKASFLTFADGTLWVGEFTNLSGNYPTDRSHRVRTSTGVQNHGWMAGFELDPQTDFISPEQIRNGVAYPDWIISIPHQVQGAVFARDMIILSHSYGRTNNSRIALHRNPLAGPPALFFDAGEGSEIPVWILDDASLVETILAPPMSEGLALYDGRVAVLFESGSSKYRATALDPLDRIQLLDILSR